MIFVELRNGSKTNHTIYQPGPYPLSAIYHDDIYDGPVIGPIDAVSYSMGTITLRSLYFDIHLTTVEVNRISFFGVYDNIRFVQIPSKEYWESVEIFNTPDKDIPLLINSPKKWVRNFVEWKLKEWSLREELIQLRNLRFERSPLSEEYKHLFYVYVYSHMYSKTLRSRGPFNYA